jgi:hypothetical protein
MYRRLGGPQIRSGRGGEEKNSHSLPSVEPLIIQPVAQRCTTELFYFSVHLTVIYQLFRVTTIKNYDLRRGRKRY